MSACDTDKTITSVHPNYPDLKYIGQCNQPQIENIVDQFLMSSSEDLDKMLIKRGKNKYQCTFKVCSGETILTIKTSAITSSFNAVLHEGAVGAILNYYIDKHNLKGFSRVVCNLHNRKTIQYRGRNNTYAHTAYIHIEGKTLADFIVKEKPDYLRMKIILNKIILYHYDAHKVCKFTHYDCHIHNIIVDENLEPHFIDYGSSYIQDKDGNSIGDELKEGSIKREPKWHHDIFKLLSILYMCFDIGECLECIKTEFQNRVDTVTSNVYMYESTYIDDETSYRDNIEYFSAPGMDPSAKEDYITEQNRYKLLYTKEVQKLNEYSQALLNLKNYLPQRCWEFQDYLGKVLEFFLGKDSVNYLTMWEYRDEFKFFQLSEELSSKEFDYDKFIEFLNNID